MASERGTWTRKIESQLDRAGLTPDGKDWLLMALDPFPDVVHPIVGMPDGSAGQSAVQTFDQQITVKAPPGISNNGTWDCHIAFIPELLDPTWNQNLGLGGPSAFAGTSVVDTGTFYNITNPNASTPNAFPWRAPLCVVTAPAGTQTFPGADASTNSPSWFNASTMQTFGFDVTGYVGTQSRVIGGGFEVTNTTNQLNVSGSNTIYTLGTENADSNSSVLDASTGTTYPSIRSFPLTRAPPATLAKASSIPNNVTIAAKEGAYVQLRMSKGQTNPPVEPLRRTRMFMGGASSSVTSSTVACGFTTACTGPWNTVGAFAPVPNLPFSQSVPFDTSGCYFNGLSAQTTLVVRLKLFIESFPTASNQVLISLVRPCPAKDPIACELYSQVSRALPPGCEVKYNNNGGWFKGLMSTIASVAPTIGNALGTVIPGAGLIGNGAGKLAEMIGGMKLGEKAQKEVDQRKIKSIERMENFNEAALAAGKRHAQARAAKKAKKRVSPGQKAEILTRMKSSGKRTKMMA